jgi:hypothetical protein
MLRYFARDIKGSDNY